MTERIEKTVIIHANAETVWEHLTNPLLMQKWMGEPEMEIVIYTDWKVGNPIVISAFHHERFEDNGLVLQFQPHQIIQYSHRSSLSGLTDQPESYTIITFFLTSDQTHTALSISIEKFPTETIFKHLDFYWRTTLEIIKRQVENDVIPR